MDCSLPGSSVPGIFQARVLEWGAIAFSDFPALDVSKAFCFIVVLAVVLYMHLGLFSPRPIIERYDSFRELDRISRLPQESIKQSVGCGAREGNGNPLQDSCLENPMDRGNW